MIIDIIGFDESKKMKVFVGMSGGVDSSLSASLLKEQGYDVTGIYMKNWTEDLPGTECPWKEDYQDAKRIAVKLGIPFEVFDFQKQYKQKVVDYMISEYKAGRTPNPDIMCNQEVKFRLFYDLAKEKGANKIAMGHYAKVVKSKKYKDQNELHMAKDKLKDQTYFLYRMPKDALYNTLLPLGDFESKKEVRKQAKKRGLITADKKDSVGICFVGKVGIKDFLSQFIESQSGPIVDQNGVEIGQHDGAIYYTIGQRHGLNVGGGLPYYVSKKDMKTNTLHVTTDLDDPELWTKEVKITNLHWLNEKPDDKKTYQVRLRYRGPLVNCKIEIEGDIATVSLEESQRGVAPGQSLVIYAASCVAGGGIIIPNE